MRRPASCRNTPELKSFSADALKQVLGAATFISAAPRHLVCHQGEVGDRFFAIIDGMVSIHVRPNQQVETALAAAAESKSSAGNQLIQTMLAALAKHRAEATVCCHGPCFRRCICLQIYVNVNAIQGKAVSVLSS